MFLIGGLRTTIETIRLLLALLLNRPELVEGADDQCRFEDYDVPNG